MASLLSLAVRGDLTAFMQAHNQALARTLTATVRATANTIRKRVQDQINRNFEGTRIGGGKSAGKKRLAQAFVSKLSFGRGVFVLNPSARVYSKALYETKGGRSAPIDLIDLYTRNETVRAAGHTWLAIPTREAPQRQGRGGARYATPREANTPLKLLPTKDPNKAVLIPSRWKKWGRSGRPPVMYVLVKQVQRTARIDVEREIARATSRISSFYEKTWRIEDQKLTAQFGRGLDRDGPLQIG